ncbi:hypothetical protein C8Q79DRAFT_903898 [Trametes meyenii]|nr:hypothetical protein C8Q79DRAFT_903898 [Trametes meyenii]
MPPVLAAVSLCLACSSSLPARRSDATIFHTQCCSRPICPNCVSANPRLTRYNPCLRCLAGVNAVKPSINRSVLGSETTTLVNIDGSVRDEDTFVIEDEDDSEDDSELEASDGSLQAESKGTPSVADRHGPNYTRREYPSLPRSHSIASVSQGSDAEREVATTPGTTATYYICPDDTLFGISLKLGVDARVLCRLNNLPISTLRVTPHLLHTRSFLVLPPSARSPPLLSPEQRVLDNELKARLARERAETRFQATTKEADRDVAKAYVALVGLPDTEEGTLKEYGKEQGLRQRRVRAGEDGGGESTLEARAMDRYLDDDEWEARERAEGRKPGLPSFPYVGPAESRRSTGKVSAEEKSWWRWRK